MTDTTRQQITEVLNRGVENIYPNREALEKALQSGKKLTIYTGIDPTGRLHVGHSVFLHKLRQLQDLGHKVIILIGDFTGMIGDPTDKAAARKPLTEKQVKENAKNYRKLVGKILDPKKTKFERNSKWHSKLKFGDVLKLASEFTVQQMLERDMFQDRIKHEKPIHVHEFMYPLMQGYDSVAMDVDMEIGGNDQTFNMLAGRTLLKSMKNKEKFVLTTKLLTDSSGKKMGKTEGNMVNMEDAPAEMYGKVMSWTDGLIVPGFELLTRVPMPEVVQIQKELEHGNNPKRLKMMLAYKLVELYWGTNKAIDAEEQFKQVFEQKQAPTDMQEVSVPERNIVDVLVATGLASSRSEARRVLSQGGVRINDEVITDETFEIGSVPQDGLVVQKGKRHFVRLMP